MSKHRRSISLPKPEILLNLQEAELSPEPFTPDYSDISTVSDDSIFELSNTDSSPGTDNSGVLDLSSPGSENNSSHEYCINITHKLQELNLVDIYSPIVKASGGEEFTVRAPKPSDAFLGKKPLSLTSQSPQVNRFLSKDDMTINTPKRRPIKETIETPHGSAWDVFSIWKNNKVQAVNVVKAKQAGKEYAEIIVSSPSI